jgi:hypothetical protein
VLVAKNHRGDRLQCNGRETLRRETYPLNSGAEHEEIHVCERMVLQSETDRAKRDPGTVAGRLAVDEAEGVWMGTQELAFAVDDPPLRLAVPEGAPGDLRAELEGILRGTEADQDLERGAASLLDLRERIAMSSDWEPGSVAVLLARASLKNIAARLMRGAADDAREQTMLREVVAEVGGLIDAGGSDALALWLSARFDLYWAELRSLGDGVTTAGDLGRSMEEAVAATRDGRLDEHDGYGLITRWIDVLDNPGLKDGALFLRAALVSIAEERYGPLAPVTLALRFLEADMLDTYGKYDRAWKRFDRLVRDVERAGETGGLLALQVRSGHAFLAGRRGAPTRAVRLYRQLLGDLEAGRFGGDSSGPFDIHLPVPGTAYQSPISLVRMNLATWLIDRGELGSAVEVLRAVVADSSRTVLEPGEPVDAAADALQGAQRMLGTTLRDLGRHEESVPVLRALLAGRLGRVPRDEALVDDARSLLIAELLRTGDHAGAKAVGEMHLGSRVERLGMKDPWTVLAAVQLGAAEHGLGSPDALPSMEAFLQELRARVGHTDERTIQARILVQAALAREGPSVEPELIEEFAQENLVDCLRLLGSRHHLTADARRAAGE